MEGSLHGSPIHCSGGSLHKFALHDLSFVQKFVDLYGQSLRLVNGKASAPARVRTSVATGTDGQTWEKF